MSTTAALHRVILSNPTVIQLTAPPKGEAARSWIQLARVGNFQSARYGKFAITKDDLRMMLHNFRNVTPKEPTELPVDYDHLSMAPKKPGDGVAAGWMKRLELRESGTELWGEVEWTPDAATRIENREYRFVSPSFVKDHVHKDGSKIGTTLLAAAITNHPFLEGMAALTLYNFSALGDLALPDTPTAIIDRAVHLSVGSRVGQVVTFKEDAESTPELSPEERAQSFKIKAERGIGDDAFVKLESVDGEPYGWYPVTAFAPAPAPNKSKENPMPNTKPDVSMQTALSEIASARGIDLNTDLRSALKFVDEKTAAGYLEQFNSGSTTPGATNERPATVHNLTRNGEEPFDRLVTRVAAERRIDLHAAIRLCSDAFPALAEAYQNGSAL